MNDERVVALGRPRRRARWWARPVVAGPLLALAGVLAFAWPAAEGGRRHVVAIEGFAFRPAELRVAAGDTVVWINRDVVPHTATDKAGGWDSGELEKGESWSFVARVPGELAYLCALHPTMKASIVVR